MCVCTVCEQHPPQSTQMWVARSRWFAVSLRPKRGGAAFLGRRLTLTFSLAPLTYTMHTGEGARVIAVCCVLVCVVWVFA